MVKLAPLSHRQGWVGEDDAKKGASLEPKQDSVEFWGVGIFGGYPVRAAPTSSILLSPPPNGGELCKYIFPHRARLRGHSFDESLRCRADGVLGGLTPPSKLLM
jgi:hypothetical protein